MNISIALNKKYFVPAYVMLTSLFFNNPEESIDVYMLYSDLTSKELECLEKLELEYNKKKIKAMYIDPNYFSDFPEKDLKELETFYRLLLMDLLPQDVSRILYLDVDIIVNKNTVICTLGR